MFSLYGLTNYWTMPTNKKHSNLSYRSQNIQYYFCSCCRLFPVPYLDVFRQDSVVQQSLLLFLFGRLFGLFLVQVAGLLRNLGKLNATS